MTATSSLGAYLGELRRQRGFAIDDISRATRIPARYLEALEQDQLAGLPAPVFVRGFIRAYCEVLGEPPGPALGRYEPVASPPVLPRPVTRPGSLPARGGGAVLVSFVLLLVMGGAFAAVTLVLERGRGGPDAPAARAEPPAPFAAAPAIPTATAAPLPAATPVDPRDAAGVSPTRPASPSGPSSPSTAGTAPPADASIGGRAPSGRPIVGAVTSPYRLVARALEPTWIRVRTGDGRASEQTIPAGQSREWVSSTPFTLTVGNAGGVTLELNGETLPPLGARGAVIPRLVLPPAQP